MEKPENFLRKILCTCKTIHNVIAYDKAFLRMDIIYVANGSRYEKSSSYCISFSDDFRLYSFNIFIRGHDCFNETVHGA